MNSTGDFEMSENGKEHKNGHEQKGDLIHNIIGHMEHLMDIFEIGIAIIVAFGFLASVYPLLRELPMLGSMSNGTTAYRHFLESALDLVIGIEFIKMLIKHTPGSVVEVLLFALSRTHGLEGGNAMENLLTVGAIAVIFFIRKFLFIESFEFLADGHTGQDWLSDWKEIRKGGTSRRKTESGTEKESAMKKKAEARRKKSEPISGDYREVNADETVTSSEGNQE